MQNQGRNCAKKKKQKTFKEPELIFTTVASSVSATASIKFTTALGDVPVGACGRINSGGVCQLICILFSRRRCRHWKSQSGAGRLSTWLAAGPVSQGCATSACHPPTRAQGFQQCSTKVCLDNQLHDPHRHNLLLLLKIITTKIQFPQCGIIKLFFFVFFFLKRQRVQSKREQTVTCVLKFSQGAHTDVCKHLSKCLRVGCISQCRGVSHVESGPANSLIKALGFFF